MAALDVAWAKAAVEVGWDVSRRRCYEPLLLGLFEGKMAESLEIRRQQLKFLTVEKVEEDRAEDVLAEEDHPSYADQDAKPTDATLQVELEENGGDCNKCI